MVEPEGVGSESPWESVVRVGLYIAAVFQLACIAALFLFPAVKEDSGHSDASSPSPSPATLSAAPKPRKTKPKESKKRKWSAPFCLLKLVTSDRHIMALQNLRKKSKSPDKKAKDETKKLREMSKSPGEKQQDESERKKDVKKEVEGSEPDGMELVAASRAAAATERVYKFWAALSFVLLMLCVGVPLWWSTTSVQRQPLPYQRIQALAERELPIPLHLSLLFADAEGRARAEAARTALLRLLHSPETAAHPRLRLRPRLRLQEAPVSLQRALAQAKDFQALSRAADHLLSGPGLSFFFLPSTAPKAPASIHFGSGRLVYVRGNPDLSEAVTKLYLSREELGEIVERHLSESRYPSSGGKMWAEGTLSPAISVDVYLINPDPASCSGPVGWDLRSLVGGPLKQLKHRLSNLTDITLSSQTLYTVDWAKRPSKFKDGWQMKESDLPHLINPMEAFITSQEPSRPVFNLLLYATPPHTSPLFITDASGEPVEGNGFLIASWGGVAVVNGCPAAMPESALQAVLSIAQSFVGAAPLRLPGGVSASTAALSDWQLERLYLLGLAEAAVGATKTLASLTRLLSQIQNIVIEEEVAGRVAEAVEGLEAALAEAEAGSVEAALAHARAAAVAADRAFFHPALLKLLYFPDDQKYAIYVPLFLPVGLPVIYSLNAILHHIKTSRAKAKIE